MTFHYVLGNILEKTTDRLKDEECMYSDPVNGHAELCQSEEYIGI